MKKVSEGNEESVLELYRHVSNLMTAEITPEQLTINELIEQAGYPTVCLSIAAMIGDFAQSYNIARNISQQQLGKAVVSLIGQYGHLTIDECLIVFERVKRGEFVSIRDRIDLQTICEMFYLYNEQENPKKKMVF